jgi:hypothetical protein
MRGGNMYIMVNREELEELLFKKLISKGCVPTINEIPILVDCFLDAVDDLYIKQLEDEDDLW